MVSFVGAVSVTSCGVISTNGTYVLSNDLTGASVTSVPVFNATCIWINANNVVLDCNGYSVTNDGTTGLTVGIVAMGNHQNVTIENCPSVSGYQYGVGLDYADYSTVRNVTAHHNRDAGIYIARSGNNNLIINNTAYFNGRGSPLPPQYTKDGFFMHSGTNNVFIDNIAYDNFYGFHMFSGASNTNLTDNTAYLNNIGTYAAASNNVWITGDHYYNNTADFSASGSGVAVSLAGVVFDNNAGDFKNYTNLSLSDVVSSAYSIDWGTEPAALPDDYVSLEDKFVNIAGGAPIDSMTWHWLQDETLGYAESTLSVWKHNGSWSDTGATLDAGANTLTLTSFNPASTYAILGKGCPVIDAPGTYVLEYDLTGAPNTFSYFAAREWACVLITSEDVVFDCNGHSITNVGYEDYGVVALGASNVEIKNCDVSGYGAAVSLLATNESIARNNTLHENYAGIQVDEGHTNLLTNNTIKDNLGGGIGVTESPYTNTTYSVVHNNSDFGIFLATAPNNTVMWNNVSLHPGGDLGYGFGVVSAYSPDSVLTNNEINDNKYGIYMEGSNNNTVSDNEVYGNSERGFSLSNANLNVLNNNIVYLNYQGFVSSNSGFNSFTGNDAYNNTAQGFAIYPGSDHNNFSSNTAENNAQLGFYIDNADNNTFVSNTVQNNERGFLLVGSANNTLTANNASLNDVGFYISADCSGTTLTSNIAKDNGQGFSFVLCSGNTASNNTVYDNTNYGFIINTANITMSGDHLYGNGDDLYVRANSNLQLSNVVIDSAGGSKVDYTELSMTDSTGSAERYTISWAADPGAPDAYHVDVANKFLNITQLAGTVSIDSLTFHWLDSESTGYNESMFELWQKEGTLWRQLNATPVPSANTITTVNLNQFGTTGLFYLVDSDGDGVPDDEDACPDTYGDPDWQGCPYADEVEGRLHIVDVAGTGACPGPGNSCWVYLENVEVRVYNRSDPIFIAKWTGHPDTADFPDIFTDDAGLVGSCTTNSSGICTAGEVEPGEYLILGKYYDEATGKTVYISAYKNPDDFVDGLATKDLRFMKHIKNNGQVEYKPVSQVYVEGEESAEPPGKGKKPAKIEEPSLGLTLAIFALLLVTALFVLRERR